MIDLKIRKQVQGESFSAIITRWRNKASQMANRPSEEDQICMMLKKNLAQYQKNIITIYFPTLKVFAVTGLQFNDVTQSRLFKCEELSFTKFKTGGRSGLKPA